MWIVVGTLQETCANIYIYELLWYNSVDTRSDEFERVSKFVLLVSELGDY